MNIQVPADKTFEPPQAAAVVQPPPPPQNPEEPAILNPQNAAREKVTISKKYLILKSGFPEVKMFKNDVSNSLTILPFQVCR